MKRPGKELEKYWYAGLTGFFVIVAALVVYAITSNLTGLGKIFGALNSALMPVYIGVVIAYLLSPLVNKSDRYIFIPLWSKIFKGKKKKASNVARGCSVFFVLLLAIFVVFGIMMLVIPEIIDSITGLAKSMPEYYNNVKNWGTHIFKSNPEFADYFTKASKDIFDKLLDWLQNDLLPNSDKFLGAITDGVMDATSVLVDFFIGLIVSIYLMAGKERFCAQAKRLLYTIFSEKRANRILSFGKDINWSFAKFFSGKIIDSIIVAIITFIALSIADIPYTALISVLVGVTNIIPFFGPYIGAIPSALLVFLASPFKGVICLVRIIIIQQVDGNIIGPKIIGESVGLESFWILFSILVFGSLFGLIGMICAVPVFSVLYKTVKRWSHRRLEKKGLPAETNSYLRKK